MTEYKWQMLLKSVLETEEVEIDCEECHEVLDMYAELLVAKGNPADVMPTVEQHLRQCRCCAGELEALMIMLNQVINPTGVDISPQ